MPSDNPRTAKFPILYAIAAQALAVGISMALSHLLFNLSGWAMPVLVQLMLTGFIAVWFSSTFRQPFWWFYIHLALPFLVVVGLMISAPAWVYPVVLVLLFLIFWNSADDRVPLYLSNKTTCQALSSIVANRETGVFFDLGCGTGDPLLTLAKKHPDWIFVGVETSPILWLLGNIRILLSGQKNIRIKRQNLWKTELTSADIVYCFLSPAPMPRLYEKATAEMKTGSLLISNSFAVPKQNSDEILQLNDQRKTQLFIWHM